MKATLAGSLLLMLAWSATAQERIAPEDAVKYAKICVASSAKQPGLQIPVQPNAEKPFGLQKENMGAMVIPNRGLSAAGLEKLARMAKDAGPVGQLWMRNLTVIQDDKPTPNDKLRLLTVNVDDRDHSLSLFLLGVRAKGNDGLELVVYAKDKKPLLVVPVKKISQEQEMPVELEGKEENDRGILTIKIVGRYQAEIPVTRQEE
jgi:hypothetical protein